MYTFLSVENNRTSIHFDGVSDSLLAFHDVQRCVSIDRKREQRDLKIAPTALNTQNNNNSDGKECIKSIIKNSLIKFEKKNI